MKIFLILRMVMMTALTFSLTGCIACIGPGGAAPGLVVSDVTYPNEINLSMDHRIVFERDDIEILEPVYAEAVSKWYFFVWSTGDSGYGNLMNQVRQAGGDGVMNVTIDTRYEFFLFLFAKIHTQLNGIAYRYKREADYVKTAPALQEQ